MQCGQMMRKPHCISLTDEEEWRISGGSAIQNFEVAHACARMRRFADDVRTVARPT